MKEIRVEYCISSHDEDEKCGKYYLRVQEMGVPSPLEQPKIYLKP